MSADRLVDDDGFELLQPAVRVFAVPHDTGPGPKPNKAREAPRQRPRRREEHTLVFDTETTTDRTQQLKFGSFCHYIDRAGDLPATTCVVEGLFYADDLPQDDPDGYTALVDYVASHTARTGPGRSHDMLLITRSEFVERFLFRIGYEKQAAIVGFNLPFDLSRIAIGVGSARNHYKGGFSFKLWEHEGAEHRYRPRVRIRIIDGQKAKIGFGPTADTERIHTRGNFIDCRTVAAAYTDQGGLSLQRACEMFGIGFTKQPQQHGVITADYVTYCRDDVAATASVYQAICREHARHPIERRLSTVFSAATIGKGYWAAMGVGPTQERHPDFAPETCGLGMEAFYGGRAECAIRNVEVPVTYVDFLSMYMTCNVLMDTWGLLTAEHLRLDNTALKVQQLLADPDLRTRCFDKHDVWPMLHTLVHVDPNGARFPVRARYRNNREDFNTGFNPFRSPSRRFWYPLADVIAATIHDGPNPIVHQAWQLRPEGLNPKLRTVTIREVIDFDPRRQDLFAELVQQRHTVKNDHTLPQTERDRLSQFLKVMANSIGFGILVQLDRDDHNTKPVPVTIYGGDGTGYDTTTHRPENPGAYCLPPLASAITGAARLMLTLLETEIKQHGGTYAFCDTDSMAIVSTRTGRPPKRYRADIPVLSWGQVDDIVNRFEQLNPYNPDQMPGSILEIEKENYTTKGTRREIRCYAISSKRYQLTTSRGRSIKASEHGLGYLKNPTEGSPADFAEAAWGYVRDPDNNTPGWLDQPAISQLTVTSPQARAWFKTLNNGKRFKHQIKPFNFLIVAYPDPLDPSAATGAHPVAAYASSSDELAQIEWLDRRTGQPINITTKPLDGHRRPGTVRVLTYRNLLDRYRQHPEAPALTPDGQTVNSQTAGQLQPRPITCTGPVSYIGKESNDLHQRATGLGDGEHLNTYNNPNEHWGKAVLPILRQLGSRKVSERTGVNLRTVQRALSGKTQPSSTTRKQLDQLATEDTYGR